MTHRILPRADYARLDGTYLAPAVPYLAADTQVVIVEQDDRIISHWTLMKAPHVECVWTHPDYRASGAAMRQLLAGMRDLAVSEGIARVITSVEADDAVVHRLLHHLRADKLPDSYVFSIENMPCR